MDAESIQVKGGIERIVVKLNDEFKRAPEKTENVKSDINRYEGIDFKNPVVKEIIDKNIEEINRVITNFNTKITFSKDKDTGKTVIKIIDRDTDKTIKMVPPEVFLKIAAKMAELIGVLVDEKI